MNQTESEITDISGTYKPCIYGKAVAAEYAAAFFCAYNCPEIREIKEEKRNEKKIHVSFITGSIYDLFHDCSNRCSSFCI